MKSSTRCAAITSNMKGRHEANLLVFGIVQVNHFGDRVDWHASRSVCGCIVAGSFCGDTLWRSFLAAHFDWLCLPSPPRLLVLSLAKKLPRAIVHYSPGTPSMHHIVWLPEPINPLFSLSLTVLVILEFLVDEVGPSDAICHI